MGLLVLTQFEVRYRELYRICVPKVPKCRTSDPVEAGVGRDRGHQKEADADRALGGGRTGDRFRDSGIARVDRLDEGEKRPDFLDAAAQAERTTRKVIVTRALAKAGHRVPAHDLEDRTPRKRRRTTQDGPSL